MAMRVRPEDWQVEATHNHTMERAIAISRTTLGSDRLYSSVVTTTPGGSTRVHHHGECETSIYVLEGRARFSFGPTGVEEHLEAERGDFVYIPAHEVHVEANASDREPLVVLVTRNCPEALTVYVD
jgi:uncharacterized RmlC-like cupin family protein